jgi:hypothetical protein
MATEIPSFRMALRVAVMDVLLSVPPRPPYEPGVNGRGRSDDGSVNSPHPARPDFRGPVPRPTGAVREPPVHNPHPHPARGARGRGRARVVRGSTAEHGATSSGTDGHTPQAGDL